MSIIFADSTHRRVEKIRFPETENRILKKELEKAGGDGRTVVLKREEAGYGDQGQPKLLLTFEISLGYMRFC